MKILKVFFLSLILMFALELTVSAQGTESVKSLGIAEMINLDEDIKPEDLEVSEPNLLPDSPFYFFKSWARNFRVFFTFNKIKKAELESKFANERLIEIKKMIKQNKNPEIIKKAIEGYKKRLERIKKRTEKIRKKASENPKVRTFLEKYTHQQILHQRLLEKLENQVPPEVVKKIKKAREKHLERFKEVMLKLEKKDKIPDMLDKILKKQKGSDFKQLKQIEFLKRLREKMPEDIKKRIKRKEKKMLERLKNKLEKLPENKQERFQKYIERISGDKEKRLEILRELKSRELKSRLKKPTLKRMIDRTRKKIEIKKIKCRTNTDCPQPRNPVYRAVCKKGKCVIKKVKETE